MPGTTCRDRGDAAASDAVRPPSDEKVRAATTTRRCRFPKHAAVSAEAALLSLPSNLDSSRRGRVSELL
jgi:hypothetical protein